MSILSGDHFIQGSVRTGRVRHSGSHEASWQHFPGN
jgi:hypothetical protein